jgi:uncharacterized protein
MEFCFFDSSAAVKNYIVETGSNWVKSIFATIPKTEIYMASITEVEVVAAFSRRRKGLKLSVTDSNTAISQFRSDFSRDFNTIDVTPKIISAAVNLSEKYSLRGYDAVQLASALEIYSRLITLGVDFNITPFTFISADYELNSTTTSEGLNVENPNNYP